MLEVTLTDKERRHITGCMRVNHAGEVSAQALYQGQALTAQLPNIREQMHAAALEEVDHLAWCEKRLQELGSHPSLINPLRYFSISLGFVEETERQVSAHLQKHLDHLPPDDLKTKAILSAMLLDETRHATAAHMAGAAELHSLIKKGMRVASLLLTKGSYYI